MVITLLLVVLYTCNPSDLLE